MGGLSHAYSPADLHIAMLLLTLDRAAEAEPYARSAVELAAQAPAAAWEAWSRQFLALALQALGRDADAHAEAARCREQASALGMHRLVHDLARAGLAAGAVAPG